MSSPSSARRKWQAAEMAVHYGSFGDDSVPETRNFQAWHRDLGGSSKLTDGRQIDFAP